MSKRQKTEDSGGRAATEDVEPHRNNGGHNTPRWKWRVEYLDGKQFDPKQKVGTALWLCVMTYSKSSPLYCILTFAYTTERPKPHWVGARVSKRCQKMIFYLLAYG